MNIALTQKLINPYFPRFLKGNSLTKKQKWFYKKNKNQSQNLIPSFLGNMRKITMSQKFVCSKKRNS